MTNTSRIICGDTLQVLKDLTPKSIDVVILDPPFTERKLIGTDKTYQEWLAEVISLSKPLLTDNGILVLMGGWRQAAVLMEEIQKKFILHRRITARSVEIVHDNTTVNLQSYRNIKDSTWPECRSMDDLRLLPAHIQAELNENDFNWLESTSVTTLVDIYIASALPELTINSQHLTTIWNDIPGGKLHTRTELPSIVEKSEQLITRIIQLVSSPGQTILDPFCGTGTIPYVASVTDRQYIGIDIDPECCKRTSKRISDGRV